MDELLELLREKLAEPWKPLGPLGLGTGLGLCALLAVYALAAADPWVPLLDGVNLMFHEAGHPLFGILGEAPALYGGTWMQLLVPLLVAGHFFWRRETLPFALSLIWVCQNLVNIARYAADATAQELPLVGGGEHDWTNILERWGALGREAAVARSFKGMALAGLFAIAAWLTARWMASRT